jgi:hypothetical protein
VLAGAETFVDIARFGAKKLALLRRFRPFRDGTPSHDHLGDIFAAVDAEAFQRCFVAWAASLVGTPAEVRAKNIPNVDTQNKVDRLTWRRGRADLPRNSIWMDHAALLISTM